MKKDPLSKEHHQALTKLLTILESAGVWYRVTGGLAGNLHGSQWPLHDIDLDYLRVEWERLAKALGEHLITAPHQYQDDEFRLVMATAQIAGIEIEFSQMEDAWGASPEGWIQFDSDSRKRELINWRGHQIWAQPLSELIAYKEVIGRQADLTDLRQILIHRLSKQ